MRFPDWVEKQERGTLKRIERQHGVAYMTLMRASQGKAVSYPIAEKLSAATGGEVSIAELCDPPPAKATRRKLKKTGTDGA